MIRRARGAIAGSASVLAIMLAAGPALAQPTPGDPRQRYSRDREQADRPRQQQQFDESLRKFQDEDLPTRLEGIAEMGQVDKKDEARALPYLLSAASDPNMSVRSKAIETLGHMRMTDATSPLVQRLFMRDTDDFTRRRILAALGMIGDKRAVEPLLDFANGKSNFETRAGAVYALGEIGDPAALPALEEIAERSDEQQLRDVAKVAIRRIRSQPVPTEIPPALAGDGRGGPPGGGR
jgi:HEAT repeat protein